MSRTFAYALSFVAGYVDACTFLALFGLFVAQLTGSFVIAGTEPVVHESGFLIKALAIPVFMLAGASATMLVSALRKRDRSAWPWVLSLELVLLAAFLVVGLSRSPFADPDQPAALIAGLCGLAAMGVQSASVRLLAHASPSTNVMTSNTTQFAIDATHQLLARAGVAGGATGVDDAVVRRRLAETARVMVGFFVGVVLGAVAYRHLGLICLVPCLVILLCLIALATSRSIK